MKLIDLNLAQQVRSVRLVSEDGIIRPETFYKYLMVWCSMDYLGYTFSQVTSVYIYHDIGFHSPCKNFSFHIRALMFWVNITLLVSISPQFLFDITMIVAGDLLCKQALIL